MGDLNSSTHLFKVRTITAFISFYDSDFEGEAGIIESKLRRCTDVLHTVEAELTSNSYEVQTIRVATNPFGEWLNPPEQSRDNFDEDLALSRLSLIDIILGDLGIGFCALGPAFGCRQISFCAKIVEYSPRFSCSANIEACDSEAATAAASVVHSLSICDTKHFLIGGLGNFRFCTASACSAFIPFFPGAKGDSSIITDGAVGFAIGLENGHLAVCALKEIQTVRRISTNLYDILSRLWAPVDSLCKKVNANGAKYMGIDTSLNPSLEHNSSVAQAVEQLKEVSTFGGTGTIAAVSAITTVLQRLPIKRTGYCGLMLPLLEDRRLSELAAEIPSKLRITQLLSISSVCGVGIDTVPVESASKEKLLALILDVAGLAHRWNKSLSCRVFLCDKEGSLTEFESPYMCNSRVLAFE